MSSRLCRSPRAHAPSPTFQAIAETASTRWDLVAITIAHRVGTVTVGQASVAIAASSPHRADALAAVAWAIDELKATVPIWKREVFVGGEVWQENAEARARVDAARVDAARAHGSG